MKMMMASIAAMTVVGVLSAPFTFADRVMESGERDMWKASQLIGPDVVNPEGEELGEIEEVVVDPREGRMGYAVLSFGGFLGLGDKYFTIPQNALRYDSQDEKMILNIDKERLEEAPGFSRDDWPNMADRTWARDIHAFYSVDPYWEDVAVVERTERMQGTHTIEGKLLRVEGQFYVVRDEDDREVSLHIDRDTEFRDEVGPGDHIRAEVTENNHALWFDEIEE